MCVLVFAGGALIDFSPARVYHSMLVSDVCFFLAAAIVATERSWTSPRALVDLLRRRRDLAAMAGVAALFVIGTGVASLVIGFPSEARDTWLLFAMLMLALVPAVAVTTSGDRRYGLALVAGIVGGSLLGAAGFAERVVIGGAPLSGSRIPGYFGGDPIFLMIVAAAIAATLVTVFVSYEQSRPRHWRAIVAVAVAVLALVVAGLVFSRSRSAWISFIAIAPTVLIVVRGSFKGATLAGLGLIAVLTVAYFASVLPHGIEDRIAMTFDVGDSGNVQRLDAVEQLIPAWVDHPWGIGLGTSPDYVSAELIEGGTRYIHNVVLNSLVEGGVLAGVAMAALPFVLIWIWITAVRRSPDLRSDWLRAWPITAAIPLYLAGLLTPTLYPHAFWVAVGALIGASLIRGPVSEEPGSDRARPAASEAPGTESAARSPA